VVFGVLFVFFCNYLYPVVAGSQVTCAFSPLGLVIMNSFRGLRHSRYKILDISVVIRRTVTYVSIMLSIYLFFFVTLTVFNALFSNVSEPYGFLPVGVSVLVVTVMLGPCARRS